MGTNCFQKYQKQQNILVLSSQRPYLQRTAELQPFTASTLSIFQSDVEHMLIQMCVYIYIHIRIYIDTHMHTKEESYFLCELAPS